MMASASVQLPGTIIPRSEYPASSTNKALALGPGLRSVASSSVQVTTAGTLQTDSRKNAIWIENTGGRYLPSVGDLVVATVHHSAAEVFHCIITPHTPFALLGQLSFEGATKKTRPNLSAGALVYGRISKVEKGGDVELECFNSATGKAEGMGPLKGGMVFDVKPELARRLTLGAKGGLVILEEVGEKMRFEVAIGRNGRIWVDADGVKETLAVGRVLREVGQADLTPDEQKKLVKKLLKDV